MNYEPYRLSRVVSIYAIVSADHVKGVYSHSEVHRHRHAWELCCCMAGEVFVRQDGDLLKLNAGDCLLTPPGIAHHILVHNPESECLVLSFTCTDSYLSALRGQVLATDRWQQRVQDIQRELRSAFRVEKEALRMMRFVPSATSLPGSEQLICCYLEELLIEMLRSVLKKEENGTADLETAMQQYLAAQITAYIRGNLSENLSVDTIARRFHYSRNRLGMLYKAVTGNSLGQAISRERIARAKELLAEVEKSVTDISAELGFSSVQYFSRKFTREVGIAPSRYKEFIRQE